MTFVHTCTDVIEGCKILTFARHVQILSREGSLSCLTWFAVTRGLGLCGLIPSTETKPLFRHFHIILSSRPIIAINYIQDLFVPSPWF